MTAKKANLIDIQKKILANALCDESEDFRRAIEDKKMLRDKWKEEIEDYDGHYEPKSFNDLLHDFINILAQRDELLEAVNLAIGFCVDFRLTQDWQNHPEIGVLFANLNAAIAKAKKD